MRVIYLWELKTFHLVFVYIVSVSECTRGPSVCTLVSRMQRDWWFVSSKAIARGSQSHLQGSSGNKWLINYA